MATPQNHFQVPNIQFRVLIIGRANAGKTSVLQRVCNTTESPKVYRVDKSGQRSEVQLKPSTERSLHDIDDELIFENHDGYIFHDSRGFESGSENELKLVQKFIQRKSREKRLKDRLHAIWFCIPMDNDRPSLDLKHFDAICPDKNVPIIALFTKYDQFKRNVKIKFKGHPETDIDAEVKRGFEQGYLDNLSSRPPPFICLERMHKDGQQCTDLIKLTADSLSGGVVALMLIAVQKDNLELSITFAISWTKDSLERLESTEAVIKQCLVPFPWMWLNLLRRFEREDGTSLPKKVLSKLQSFVSEHLSISNQNAYHTMIVTIIILDYACRFRASSPGSTHEEAIDEAYSRYKQSGTHEAIKAQFPGSPDQYYIPQLTEFVLQHRL